MGTVVPVAAVVLDPADWSCCTRLAVLFGSLAVAAVLNGAFARAKQEMVASGGPGVVAFELIGSWERADAALARWNTGERKGWRAARWATAIDFLFIAAYAVGLGALARIASDHASDRDLEGWAVVGLVALCVILAAALLDVVENIALFCVLADNRAANWPGIATACAVAKFALLAIGILLVVTSGMAFLGPA